MKTKGFSLVELLVTIVILSILCSMVVTAVSNASVDSSRVVARQQQASLQTSLQAWVLTGPLEEQKEIFLSKGNVLERLELISAYCDPLTIKTLEEYSSSGKIQSKALKQIHGYLSLVWDVDGPRVKFLEEESL